MDLCSNIAFYWGFQYNRTAKLLSHQVTHVEMKKSITRIIRLKVDQDAERQNKVPVITLMLYIFQ